MRVFFIAEMYSEVSNFGNQLSVGHIYMDSQPSTLSS